MLVVIGTCAVFTYLFFAHSWVGDDAYITFRVVDNFVNGYGLRWHPAERVQAYTNPLWLFLLTRSALDRPAGLGYRIIDWRIAASSAGHFERIDDPTDEPMLRRRNR